MTNEFNSRIDLSPLHQGVQRLRSELQKVVVGQHALIDNLIVSVLSNGHALIEGVPGVAKTLSAKLLAHSISSGFSRIQFTPDLMPSDILGTSVFNQKTTEFEFKQGPIFSNLILIDEINRAPAKTQAALFEVMEERQITLDGRQYNMQLPFLVFATQNPIEQEGTYRLPEAQLDRFMMKIEVAYPTDQEELLILKSHHTRTNNNPLAGIERVISGQEVLEYQHLVRQVHAEESLLQYIAAIVTQTRNFSGLYLGASPRASFWLLQAAKAKAAIAGRDFITPDDVQHMAFPVLRHRIMLTPDKEMEGSNTNEVIKQILEKIEVPR
jgi:MoxR-like ATPase